MRAERQSWSSVASVLVGALVMATPSSSAETNPSSAGSQEGKSSYIDECKCEGKTCSLGLVWGELKEPSTEIRLDREFLQEQNCFCGLRPGKRRITAEHSLHLTIKRFNFLRFALKVEKEEEAVAAYAELATLWKRVLGLGGLVDMSSDPKEGREDEFLKKLMAWEARIKRTDQNVDDYLGKYVSSILSDAEVEEISTASKNLDKDVEELEAMEVDAVAAAIRATTIVDGQEQPASDVPAEVRLQLVRDLREKQGDVVARVKAFSSRARSVEHGARRLVRPSGVGSVVSVTLTAVDLKDAGEEKVAVLRYFVSSALPIVLHGGYGQADLSDFEFETIRTINGLEAYDLVKDDSQRDGFLLFLSVPMISFDDRERFGLLATLGTDLKSPGDSLAAGISARLFGRFFVTYGRMSAEVAEGVDPFVDEIGGALGVRELFATVDKRRDWGEFWGVSMSIDF